MIDRVVLDIELAKPELAGEPVGADERREAGMKAGPRLTGNRQQLAEAPDIARPALDDVARHRFPGAGVVVDHLERPEALAAHPERLGRIFRPAQMALQPGHERHASPSR